MHLGVSTMKKYIVRLTEAEREFLENLVKKGKSAASKINRGRILLKADENQEKGGWTDKDIGEALDVSIRTIERARQRFVEEGLEAALKPRPGQGRKRKLHGEVEAHLITLRCSDPPKGRGRWTLQLLADQMVDLKYVDEISNESVRQILKKQVATLAERLLGDTADRKCGVCLENESRIGCVSNRIRPSSSSDLP